MRVGYSITSFYARGTDPRAAAANVVERARIASEAGLDSIEAGDHHNVSGGGYLQNEPMAARLTQHFDRVGTLYLLPLYDPVAVAENFGTIAALCPEPEFWCGVGYGEEQFRAFNVPMRERPGRMEEALEILTLLWSEDGVSYDGDYYTVSDVSVNPKADPRMVIGGTAEPAVRRAGRWGDAWVANADLPAADIPERIEWVEEEGGGEISVRRDVICLPDGDEARERKDEMMARGYRGWPADADWVWAGTPEDVAERMAALADLGVSEVVCRPMTDEHAAETLRGLGRARELV